MNAPRPDPDRFALVGSVILLGFFAPFLVVLVYLAAMHATPTLLPVFGFALLCAVGLCFVAVGAPYRAIRDPRVRADLARACPRCAGCGLPATDSPQCAWCAMPRSDLAAWWRVDRPPWMESVAGVFFGLGTISLGLFLLAAPFAHTVRGAPAVLLAILGAGAMFFGVSIAHLAAKSVGVQWRLPLTLSLQRTWQRDGAPWSASAKAVRTDAGWRAEGSCEGYVADPAEGPAASDDPFARGLARVLASWDRDGRAPLACVSVATWSWASDVEVPAGDASAYRGSPTTRDPSLRRAVSQVWRVSFNTHAFGELLEAEGLPAAPETRDDDEAAELSDAEWDVDVAMIARVVQRDAALREAIAARGSVAAPDDETVTRALRAVLSG